MAIEISAADVARAETFLASLLTEEVPEGRYSEGTALRDLTVKAFAYIFAHLTKENVTIQSLQNLRNVQNIATGDVDTDRAVANAVDALLSNWFLTRRTGSFSRGVITALVSRRQDYVFSPSTRFLYTRTLAFYPDVSDTQTSIIIPASELVPSLNISGEIEGYTFTQAVVAAETGDAYNVLPGDWLGTGDFSAYVTRVYNTEQFSAGRERETTTEMIDRSSTAISTRNLINMRSIDSTLRENYLDIVRLLTVGFGDPEMQRDKKLEFASGMELHVGGHFDVFLELPIIQTTFEGQLGGFYTRPDGIASVFKDETTLSGNTWTTVIPELRAGDVIRITAGLSDAPRDFTIHEVRDEELWVSNLSPFAEATDEELTFVDYFIYRPLHGRERQLYPASGVLTTGQTSRTTQVEATLVLPAGPHYDILSVSIVDPDTGSPFINSSDGTIHFPIRTNDTPAVVTNPAELEYQIEAVHQEVAQSQRAYENLILDPQFDGKTVRVVYETLSGFETIHEFATDRFERVLAADVLIRGFFPVYLSLSMEYDPKVNAGGEVNETTVNEGLVNYINNFDPTETLDVSDLQTQARLLDENLGIIYPFDITYYLIAPDGRIINYTTSDKVTLDSDKLDEGQDFENPLAYALSARNIRYITRTDLVEIIPSINDDVLNG